MDGLVPDNNNNNNNNSCRGPCRCPGERVTTERGAAAAVRSQAGGLNQTVAGAKPAAAERRCTEG